MQAAGIQISARFAGGNTQAGDLKSPGLTPVLGGNGVAYLNHTAPLPAVAGRVEFKVEWAVPEASGDVVINAALVAGNNDASPLGDSVVTVEQHVRITPDGP
jgi:hypothetical protein